jgi:hypothetical protein
MKSIYVFLRQKKKEIGSLRLESLPSYPDPVLTYDELEDEELGNVIDGSSDLISYAPVLPLKLITPTLVSISNDAQSSWGISAINADR